MLLLVLRRARYLSRMRLSTCAVVAKVLKVARKTLTKVLSSSPVSEELRLSTSLSRVPAFRNHTRTVSHSRWEMSSSSASWGVGII